MEDAELTNKELSRLLDLTPGRVSQLAAQGKITQLPNGKYPTAAIQEYLSFLRGRIPADNPISKELLKEKYRALKRENDLAESKVAPVELLKDALEKRVCGIIVANLEALPALVRKHWPEVTEEQLDMVRKSVTECQQVAREMRIEV